MSMTLVSFDMFFYLTLNVFIQCKKRVEGRLMIISTHELSGLFD